MTFLNIKVKQISYKKDLIPECSFRHAIGYLYLQKCDCFEPKEWKGRDGAIRKCMKLLGVEGTGRYSTVKRVFEKVLQCKNDEIQVNFDQLKANRKGIIPLNSVYSRIIANAIEKNYSLTETTLLVNEVNFSRNEVEMSRSAIRHCISKMNPKTVGIEKLSQGDTDVMSGWAVARENLVRQLLIRNGALDWNAVKDGEPPDYFNVKKLTRFVLCQNVYWDENHIKVKAGTATETDRQTLFPRDDAGNLDLINGTYSEERGNCMNIKFADEIRRCCGVAKISLGSNNQELGVRCKSFDYSGKTLISIEAEEQNILNECIRVNNLKVGEDWKEPKTINRNIYCNDPITIFKDVLDKDVMKGIGYEYLKKIGTELNIISVSDLLDYKSNGSIKECPKKFATKLQRLLNMCYMVSEGDRPKRRNFKDAVNPYEARYGSTWRDEIKKVGAMSKHVCITEMVQHIYDESKRIMMGTNYEDNWFFYHDALSLMTSKECKKWMDEKGILKHWILPENGLNDGTNYAKRPVGNSPEMMPLDCSLFQDLLLGIRSHIIYTGSLDRDDPKKFSFSTIERAQSAIDRLWLPYEFGKENFGYPPEGRIRGDIEKTIPSMHIILNANGAVVPGIGNRSGRRWQRKGNWGGRRSKSFGVLLSKQKYIHEDAVLARNMLKQEFDQSFEPLITEISITENADENVMEMNRDDESVVDDSDDEELLTDFNQLTIFI